MIEKIKLLFSGLQTSILLVSILVVLAGVGTGFLLFNVGGGIVSDTISVAPGAKVTDETIGLEDERTFKDESTGKLEEGGIDGEGTHHLMRDGGPSQNVYLTSSVIDLDEFVGKKVQVWGETHKGQRAGWLMDVGRIKVIEN